jgi:hypothetical protein
MKQSIGTKGSRQYEGLTSAEITTAVAARGRRAGAAIAAAMRRQVPEVGARVETVDRWAVEYVGQIAIVECLGRPEPSERYAVVSTSHFGFGDLHEAPPMRVELTLLGWTLCRWSAERLASAHLRRARIRAAIAYVAEQALALRDEEYTDLDNFVDEATATVLAEVETQVTR